MFLSRNKNTNVYPCKPHFYYIKVGFKGSTSYRHVFVMGKIACSPSEESNLSAHPRMLIRIFTVNLEPLWILGYPQSTLRRLRSDSADLIGNAVPQIIKLFLSQKAIFIYFVIHCLILTTVSLYKHSFNNLFIYLIIFIYFFFKFSLFLFLLSTFIFVFVLSTYLFYLITWNNNHNILPWSVKQSAFKSTTQYTV